MLLVCLMIDISTVHEMYNLPMLTPMFKPGVLMPIAATSVQRRTTLDLEIDVLH